MNFQIKEMTMDKDGNIHLFLYNDKVVTMYVNRGASTNKDDMRLLSQIEIPDDLFKK